MATAPERDEAEWGSGRYPAGPAGPYPPEPVAPPSAYSSLSDEALARWDERTRRGAGRTGSAVVVGGGVGGLAAAGALGRSGWQVTLLERGDRLRGTGGAVLIWPNGLAALASLGLSLGDASYPVLAGGIRRLDGRWLLAPSPAGVGPYEGGGADPTTAGPEDEGLAAIPLAADPGAADQATTLVPAMGASGAGGAASPLVVPVDDLHDALMAGLGDSVEIRTGTEVTMVRAGQSERPAVGNGRRTFEADLIIAADGANSLVRRRLQPRSALVSAGYTAWRAAIPWFRAPAFPPSMPESGELIGSGQRFLYAILGERGASGSSNRGGVYWTATAPGAERPEPPATQLALLRRWFAQWPAPVTDLLAATEPDDLLQQPGVELRPLPRQFGVAAGFGGYVLIGDAAHAASPSLRIGANVALEDVATLRALLRASAGSLSAVLAQYTIARRPRAERVARVSHRLGEVLQARGRWSVPARDALLGRVPTLLARANAAAVAWTPPFAGPFG